jgi:hypothetical protein
MLNKIPLILVALMMGCTYPNGNDVDNFFNNLSAYTEDGTSYQKTKKFLNNLKNPTDKEKDQTLIRFLDRLASYYIEKNDENILRAVDETKIQAGFANYVCGHFYSVVIKSEQAEKWYKRNQPYIFRCAGLSFSETELKTLILREN